MTSYRKKGGPAVGLEIGTSSIKAVLLGPGGKVQQAAMTPTPIGSIREGDVIEPQAIADQIRSLLSSGGMNTRQVITAVSNQAAVTRNIMVPRMELKELRGSDMIRFEAERYIPFPLDEVTLDYDVLDDPANISEDGQMEVVIAAVPNDIVNRQLEAIRMAGLETVVVDTKSFAALRALGGNLGPEEVMLVLEIGASSSVIGLIRGERLLMSRNIGVSADDFTTALQKAFELDFASAESLKLAYHTDPAGPDAGAEIQGYSPIRITEALRPVMLDLITEVRRSLEFYRVQSGDLVIDQLLLAGGGAKLSGLQGAMSEALGIPTEVARPWGQLDLSGTNATADYLEEFGPEFTVPLGLAMRGVTNG